MASQPFVQFLEHAVETIVAIAAPLGGGLATYAKYKKSTERDRRAREEATRIAAERATTNARQQEQEMRDRLLSEKDSRIQELSQQLAEERAENKQLQRYLTERGPDRDNK
jgi:hypothetical protein